MDGDVQAALERHPRGTQGSPMSSLIRSLITRPLARHRNARRLAIDSPDGIDEGLYVPIGGIEQWLTIRGEDRRNPAVLFLHGGPGAGHTMFNPLTRPWERHFTLVQWDQRGAGRSRRRSGALRPGELTLDRLERDAVEVVELVRDRLGKEKLILVASSAGSTFGVAVAKHRPDLLHAYVGTDQNTGPAATALSYRLTLDWLRESGNARGARAIEAIGPDPERWTKRQTDTFMRWAIQANPSVPNMITDVILPALMSSPEHTMRDIRNMAKGMEESTAQWHDQFAAYDPLTLGTDFEIPFFIFQGDTDAVTPAAAARAYFDEITAPHKEFVLIERSGHLAMFTRPDQFLTQLLHRVRPLATGPRAVGA
jgi:pimeloyl-ACP methyl ester carboxylesterase